MSAHEEPETDFDKEELPEGVVLKEHSYDGIREYDQRLPRWWMITLLGAILFSIIYWTVYDPDAEYTGDEKTQLEARLAEIQAARLANSIDVTDDALFWEMADSEQFVLAGKETYDNNCATCHGTDLQGGIGFNLVDAEWVHGSQPSAIYITIDEGIPDKGMQAWGSLLGQKRIAEVVAYILEQNPNLRAQ
ncbi:MAG: cbb3-type cytochrome c oxidase N-terminal domain-containing protein [Opitutales bacterium]